MSSANIQEPLQSWPHKIQAYSHNHRRLFPAPLGSIHHPPHRSLAEHYAGNLPPSTGDAKANYSAENVVCATVLLELVILRQYLGLDSTCDAEIYEASRILEEEEYLHLEDGNTAMKARVSRQRTSHEQAFACCTTDLAQLKKVIDQEGNVSVEDPSDLTSVFNEDGSLYMWGSFEHEWKKDMTLSGELFTPQQTPFPGTAKSPSSPRPFPQLDRDKTPPPPPTPPKKSKGKKKKAKIDAPAPAPTCRIVIPAPGTGKRKLDSVQTTLPFRPQRTLRSTSRGVLDAGVGTVDKDIPHQHSPPSKRSKKS
jgi:hypothetical protein